MFLFLEPISPYIVGMSVSCEFIAKCVRGRGSEKERGERERVRESEGEFE